MPSGSMAALRNPERATERVNTGRLAYGAVCLPEPLAGIQGAFPSHRYNVQRVKQPLTDRYGILRRERQLVAEYKRAAGQGFGQVQISRRQFAGRSGGFLPIDGEFRFCEDGIDPDTGGFLFRDAGQKSCHQSPGPGPPAEAGQGVVVQSHYQGAGVPSRRGFLGNQTIKKPAVKVG